MKIPKSFKLFGQTITVEYNNELIHNEDRVGQAFFRENKIQLQGNTEGTPILKSQIEQSFLHELFHYIFYFSENENLKNLSNDENIINICSRLFHQFIVTNEGELK